MLAAEWSGADADDRPILLLLHGLGLNGAVWDGVRARLGDRYRLLVPDFAGHGGSPRVANYSLGRHAADVAALLPAGASVRILGHSMGGAVGLLLATGWYGIAVEEIAALGIKLTWSDQDLERMGRPFPVRLFESRAAAAERFLKVTGLAGAAAPEARVVERGLVEEDGGWRLAADPETVRVVGPDVRTVIRMVAAAGTTKIRLACGTRDPLVGIDEMRVFDPDAVAIEGGHNAHVEAPAAVAALIA